MIAASSSAGKDVAVFGLARSGLSSVRALKAGGAHVFAWDDRESARADAERLGASVVAYPQWPWDRIAQLVLSPGVPLTHPAPHDVVQFAQRARIEIIGDVELFAREVRPDRASSGRAPVIAVTGTNGKSTTTALIGHVLAASGFAAETGGNIGKPVLDLAAPNGRTVYALEISSYQIDLSPGLAPDVAVLTNIAPDHIDRHGSLEAYVSVKSQLLERVPRGGQVCIGVDDPHSSAIHTRLSARGDVTAIPVSIGKVLGRGVFAVDGVLYDALASRAMKVMDFAGAPRLLGAHNWQNAALAFAATLPFVKDVRAVADAIASFPGLPHRIEEVARAGKVRFVNDSKATNADAAAKALACYSDVFWIAGGRAKEGGIESLSPYFRRLRKAYLIGEASSLFAQTLDGHVAHELCGTLDNAVAQAFADARISGCAQPVVLLSPACASFDQFRDFEARGDVFRTLAREIASHPVREAS